MDDAPYETAAILMDRGLTPAPSTSAPEDAEDGKAATKEDT